MQNSSPKTSSAAEAAEVLKERERIRNAAGLNDKSSSSKLFKTRAPVEDQFTDFMLMATSCTDGPDASVTARKTAMKFRECANLKFAKSPQLVQLLSLFGSDARYCGQTFGKSSLYVELTMGMAAISMANRTPGASPLAMRLLRSLKTKTGNHYNRSTASSNPHARGTDGLIQSDRSTSVQAMTDAYVAFMKCDLACNSISRSGVESNKVVPKLLKHGKDKMLKALVYDEDILEAAALDQLESTAWQEQLQLHKDSLVGLAKVVDIQDKEVEQKIGEKDLKLWTNAFNYACEFGPITFLQNVFPRTVKTTVLGSNVSWNGRFAEAANTFHARILNHAHPGKIMTELMQAADLTEHWLHTVIMFETTKLLDMMEHGAIKVQRLGSRVLSIQSPFQRTCQWVFDQGTHAFESGCGTTTLSPAQAVPLHEAQGALLWQECHPTQGPYHHGTSLPCDHPIGKNAPTTSLKTLLPSGPVTRSFDRVNSWFAPRAHALKLACMLSDITDGDKQKYQDALQTTWCFQNDLMGGEQPKPDDDDEFDADSSRPFEIASRFVDGNPESLEFSSQVLNLLTNVTRINENYEPYFGTPVKTHPGYMDAICGAAFKPYVMGSEKNLLYETENLTTGAETDMSSFTDVLDAFVSMVQSMFSSATDPERSPWDWNEHFGVITAVCSSYQKIAQSEDFAGKVTTNQKGKTVDTEARVHGPGCKCCSVKLMAGIYTEALRKAFRMGDNMYVLKTNGLSQGFCAHVGTLLQIMCRVGLGLPMMLCIHNDDGCRGRREPNDAFYFANRAKKSTPNGYTSITEDKDIRNFALAWRAVGLADVGPIASREASQGGMAENSKKSHYKFMKPEGTLTCVYRALSRDGVSLSMNVSAGNAINNQGCYGVSGLSTNFQQTVVPSIAAAGLPMSVANSIGLYYRLLLPLRSLHKWSGKPMPFGSTDHFSYMGNDALRSMLQSVKEYEVPSNLPDRSRISREIYVEVAKSGRLLTPAVMSIDVKKANKSKDFVRGYRLPTRLANCSSFKSWKTAYESLQPVTICNFFRRGYHRVHEAVVQDEKCQLSCYDFDVSATDYIESIVEPGMAYSSNTTFKLNLTPWHGNMPMQPSKHKVYVLDSAEKDQVGKSTRVIHRRSNTAAVITRRNGMHEWSISMVDPHTTVQRDYRVGMKFFNPTVDEITIYYEYTADGDAKASGSALLSRGPSNWSLLISNQVKLTEILVTGMLESLGITCNVRYITTPIKLQTDCYLMVPMSMVASEVDKTNIIRALMVSTAHKQSSSIPEALELITSLPSRSTIQMVFVGRGAQTSVHELGSDRSTAESDEIIGDSDFNRVLGVQRTMLCTNVRDLVSAASLPAKASLVLMGLAYMKTNPHLTVYTGWESMDPADTKSWRIQIANGQSSCVVSYYRVQAGVVERNFCRQAVFHSLRTMVSACLMILVSGNQPIVPEGMI